MESACSFERSICKCDFFALSFFILLAPYGRNKIPNEHVKHAVMVAQPTEDVDAKYINKF